MTLMLSLMHYKQKSRGSEFDLDEFFQTFSRKEFVLLFNALHRHLQQEVPDDMPDEDKSEIESQVGI